MTELVAKIVTFFYLLEQKLKAKASEEVGAVDIVAIVVVIGVAVLLAIIFKDALSGLIESLFGTITDKAQDLVGG